MTHIVYGIDDKYLPCLLVSMYSILRSISTPIKFTVITTSQEFDSSSINKLVNFFSYATVEFQKLDVENLAGYATSSTQATRYSEATMIPLFVPSLVDEKCIFLDADTLVLKDISQLFESDLQGFPIGAVQSYDLSVFKMLIECSFLYDLFFRTKGKNFSESSKQTADGLGISLEDYVYKYFSAGVIIFDSKAIRKEESLFGKLTNMDECKKYWNLPPEEGYLNILFKNRVCYLDIKWNVYRDFPRISRRHFPAEIKTELISAIRDPSILHIPTIFTKRPWERPWYRARKRYRIYKRICLEMHKQTGINIFPMVTCLP